jgi:uncharacterized Ntn-hydrolase superfamily protein
MTFSVVACCPQSGALGVAVSTAVPAVGAICPYVRAGVGAVSTQAWVNPYLAINALDLLAQGHSVREALDQVLHEDVHAQLRQIGIVDAHGAAFNWTGTACAGWAGAATGAGYTIQGNMLAGPETVAAMQESFEASFDMKLEERLLMALEAGQASGGDKRGSQSASLTIYREERYPYLDLRVDEHCNPVKELRRVFDIAVLQLLPFVDSMPTGTDPSRVASKAVTALMLTPPALRPSPSRAGQQATATLAQVKLLEEILGIDFAPDRALTNIAEYRRHLVEIRKLRELDFDDIHPAVVFDPTMSWRRSDE